MKSWDRRTRWCCSLGWPRDSPHSPSFGSFFRLCRLLIGDHGCTAAGRMVPLIPLRGPVARRRDPEPAGAPGGIPSTPDEPRSPPRGRRGPPARPRSSSCAPGGTPASAAPGTPRWRRRPLLTRRRDPLPAQARLPASRSAWLPASRSARLPASRSARLPAAHLRSGGRNGARAAGGDHPCSAGPRRSGSHPDPLPPPFPSLPVPAAFREEPEHSRRICQPNRIAPERRSTTRPVGGPRDCGATGDWPAGPGRPG